jgi:hypothetical protein
MKRKQMTLMNLNLKGMGLEWTSGERGRWVCGSQSCAVFCRKRMPASATTTRKEKAPRKQRMKKEKHVDSDSDEDYASDVREFKDTI